MKRSLATVLCMGILVLGAHPAAAAGSEPSPWESVLGSYERIRLTLLQDSTEGVAGEAAKLRSAAQALGKDFSADAAEVEEAHAEELKMLLPEIAGAAKLIQVSEDIEETRKQFYLLSKALVRWREWSTRDSRPVVVWCPMAKKSWLQPAGEIGNPYHGQMMPRCGRIVSK